MNAPNCQPELQQSHIASLQNFENMGNVIKHAHRLANSEKKCQFWAQRGSVKNE